MNVKLRVWRQRNTQSKGEFVEYEARDLVPEMSFLEMLDTVNEHLERSGEEPIAFAYDCREGICGTCSLTVNGRAHGPGRGTAICQVYMREFKSGETVTVEPFRARAFPVIRDLVTDRSALDRIIESGGYISVRTGSAPEANSIPVPKDDADLAFDAAACIGCGACVAQCPNSAAMLFTSAKVAHLSLMPQGQPERDRRVVSMVDMMDRAGFGNCTNYYECSAVCPKLISPDFMARMYKEYVKASVRTTFTTAKKPEHPVITNVKTTAPPDIRKA